MTRNLQMITEKGWDTEIQEPAATVNKTQNWEDQ